MQPPPKQQHKHLQPPQQQHQEGHQQQPQRRRRGRGSGREDRSLACLLMAMEGRKLVVEMRNDLILRGTLEQADELMNLFMSAVSSSDSHGKRQEMEQLYVRGRNVRFVHLPRSFDPAAALETQRQKQVEARILAFKQQQQQSAGHEGRTAKGDGGAAYAEQHAAATSAGRGGADAAVQAAAEKLGSVAGLLDGEAEGTAGTAEQQHADEAGPLIRELPGSQHGLEGGLGQDTAGLWRVSALMAGSTQDHAQAVPGGPSSDGRDGQDDQPFDFD